MRKRTLEYETYIRRVTRISTETKKRFKTNEYIPLRFFVYDILTIRGVSILIRFDILVFVISLIVYYLSLFFSFYILQIDGYCKMNM